MERNGEFGAVSQRVTLLRLNKDTLATISSNEKTFLISEHPYNLSDNINGYAGYMYYGTSGLYVYAGAGVAIIRHTPCRESLGGVTRNKHQVFSVIRSNFSNMSIVIGEIETETFYYDGSTNTFVSGNCRYAFKRPNITGTGTFSFQGVSSRYSDSYYVSDWYDGVIITNSLFDTMFNHIADSTFLNKYIYPKRIDDVDGTIYFMYKLGTGQAPLMLIGFDNQMNITKTFNDFQFGTGNAYDGTSFVTHNAILTDQTRTHFLYNYTQTYTIGGGTSYKVYSDIVTLSGLYTQVFEMSSMHKLDTAQLSPVLLHPSAPSGLLRQHVGLHYTSFPLTSGSWFAQLPPTQKVIHDARQFAMVAKGNFTLASGITTEEYDAYVGSVGDGSLYALPLDLQGEYKTLYTFSGEPTRLETSNTHEPPYFFVSTSGGDGRHFWQRDPLDANFSLSETNLPNSAITVIRTDDRT